MRAVLQRVTEATVTVDGGGVGKIGRGILALVGVANGDTETDAVYIAGKIADLRIFSRDDAAGESEAGAEQSLRDVGGAALVVSQFTLLGDARKGRRPSWSGAAPPDEGRRLYEAVVVLLRDQGIPVQTGTFRTQMQVSLTNDGPFTILLDSRRAF
ncbi:MAG: D-tyrosyl-tRNA(Tyr) deacylase [Cytophagales bacterium]|nr:D-tyrosyl-tRNA(Tyr) deacylase [Armatimonadota bacterium]